MPKQYELEIPLGYSPTHRVDTPNPNEVSIPEDLREILGWFESIKFWCYEPAEYHAGLCITQIHVGHTAKDGQLDLNEHFAGRVNTVHRLGNGATIRLVKWNDYGEGERTLSLAFTAKE